MTDPNDFLDPEAEPEPELEPVPEPFISMNTLLRNLPYMAALALATTRTEAMAARDRWVLVEENGDLWLLKREGPEVRGRIVSREGLRREFPRLYAELIASNNKDTPRVVVER
jgi:hypothetical protein